jgi:uncharacterized repeat protein (TIGR03803 family)
MKNHLLSVLVLIVTTTSLCKAQHPVLWGMTTRGGAQNTGLIFKYTTATDSETDIHDFGNGAIDGQQPYGSLIPAGNGLLYGMTAIGGANSSGTIFSYNSLTGTETDIYDFGNGADGQNPYGSLIRVSDTLLYGMNEFGGADNDGTIFSYNISTGDEIVLHSFGSYNYDGENPSGSLIQASNDLLYGMTTEAGDYNGGTLFSYNISTDTEIVLHSFGGGQDGGTPLGSLIQVTDSLLYGLTPEGGANSGGTIFKYNISTAKETDIHDFGNGTDGSFAEGSLIRVSDTLLYGVTRDGGANGNGTIFSYNILTGKETDIHDFGSGTDGINPQSALIQAGNGLLYGVTSAGGANGDGIIFSYNISKGIQTDIHDFGSGTDGHEPFGSFIQAKDSLLYGMTAKGGAYSEGTILSYDISTGTETDLHNFGDDGISPSGSLIKAKNDLLYGMTSEGGANSLGTIFNYNISTGMENDINNFDLYNPVFNGNNPQGSLIQASDGLIYGMTSAGGDSGVGVIFSYNISTGYEFIMHEFGSGTDGYSPHGSLMQANDSLLYGMTFQGGANDDGIIFSYDTYKDTEIDIHDFGSDTDGLRPEGALIQANNNLLYGMTVQGGANNFGIIFSYDILKGKETDIHDFGNGADGVYPEGSLIQAHNGLLYGMTKFGGVNGNGMIFSYNILTGKDSDIHDFGSGTDGYGPLGSLMQASDSLLYGMTYNGGANSDGIIFSYNIPKGIYTDIHDFTGADGKYPVGDLIEDDTVFVSSINQLSVNNNLILIYPNPTSGQFNIKLNGNQSGCIIEVYNLMSEKVYQSVLSNSQNIINLSSQPGGIYFVYLKSDEDVEVGKVLLTK